MPTSLPTDSNNNPIPALGLKDNGAHKLTVSATSTRNTIAFSGDTQIVSFYATVPVYIRFGGAGVVATTSDHYFPAGYYYDFSIGGDGTAHKTHIAVLRESTNGMAYISEKI
ncbi:MAG: hypothetical protein RBR86_06820 [Pseudobdellovibrionaceae bacterium]|jgi:hypothetical protein|nr:hypothetical protein [Pseudobdellovibrionaceae bacterium]